MSLLVPAAILAAALITSSSNGRRRRVVRRSPEAPVRRRKVPSRSRRASAVLRRGSTTPPVKAKPASALQAAKALAPSVAGNIKANKYNYDRKLLKTFQKHAGLVVDGIYGGASGGALAFYNGGKAPEPLFKPKKFVPYKPRVIRVKKG